MNMHLGGGEWISTSFFFFIFSHLLPPFPLSLKSSRKKNNEKPLKHILFSFLPSEKFILYCFRKLPDKNALDLKKSWVSVRVGTPMRAREMFSYDCGINLCVCVYDRLHATFSRKATKAESTRWVQLRESTTTNQLLTGSINSERAINRWECQVLPKVFMSGGNHRSSRDGEMNFSLMDPVQKDY